MGDQKLVKPVEIKCIFFSEFHPTTGPKIVYQVPTDFPLQDPFDGAHDYIITKPHLYDRLIAVDLDGLKIAGCPKGIQNKKYDRNAFIFNFCFVFEGDCDITPYEGVIRKVGASFKEYEVDSDFLKDEKTRKNIPEILRKVLYQLNTRGYCHVPIDEFNTLNLKIIPLLSKPPQVMDYHVPIFTCNLQNLSDLEWDLTINQILQYIDGFNHVSKIADEADIDKEVVRISIQHLVLYGFASLISIFQYSNMYIVTDSLRNLYKDRELQQWVMTQVALPGKTAKFSDLFKLYCSLEHGQTVRDLCLRHDPNALNIDVRSLIQVGLMRRFIRRLHKYPILKVEDASLPRLLEDVKHLLNGSHHFDEICCELNISYKELDEAIEKATEDSEVIIVIWK